MSRGVVLVTGGTRGIGLGIARALAREGWKLALCGLRPLDAISPVLDELRSAGTEADYWRADIGNAHDRAALLTSAISRYGTLDALVNNAGRAPRVRADLLEANENSFEEVMRTNLQGPYFLTQSVARLMVEQAKAGAIVFVTSASADMASTNRGEYCVSKAGMSMAARLFAVRLAAHRIPVYEVRPGII
jgi:NAD(P)-dependent dehydrogenase (short-subunit alcohol dehydrogenase family)